MTALPILLVALCVLSLGYRFYGAFLATKVLALDDSHVTPAHRLNDHQNYHPTNKWVLFGHHFAAISGAGPLVGPVLACQFGYFPGLAWLLGGVVIGGAVQDFTVLIASVRRGGRSLAEIAHEEIGPVAGIAGAVAILFIIVNALAGLGLVVVKALGGESHPYPAGSVITQDAAAKEPIQVIASGPSGTILRVPGPARLTYPGLKEDVVTSETVTIVTPGSVAPGSVTSDGVASGSVAPQGKTLVDRKSTRLNSSH